MSLSPAALHNSSGRGSRGSKIRVICALDLLPLRVLPIGELGELSLEYLVGVNERFARLSVGERVGVSGSQDWQRSRNGVGELSRIWSLPVATEVEAR